MSEIETGADDAEQQHPEEDTALLSSLGVIEDQPLADRAAAYVQVYDQLQGRLEGGTAVRG